MTSLQICLLTLLLLGLALANPSPKHHKSHKSSRSGKHHSKHSRSGQDLQDLDQDHDWQFENQGAVDTRRILYGRRVAPGKRPYMVYLQLTTQSAKIHKYRGWLCGGVIVHPEYVLTSAACVEDAEHFYIVSGTTKFVESLDYKKDPCVCKNRRRVIWKCIPKNYKYDFQDSLKWSANDIAIVKVDRPFKLGQQEQGCEFATDLVCYNNVSRELEKSGTRAWIAGWGSMGNFREGVYRRQGSEFSNPGSRNAKCLQEAKVCTMDNDKCARKWAQKFRPIINEYMVCTKDVVKRLSEICDKKYANCSEIENQRRQALKLVEDPPQSLNVDLGRHLLDPADYSARRSLTGGFCENDHGGPLLVTYQNKERVIGVMSACKIDAKSHSCHGPFLYTSIFKNRQFLSCAIYKDVEDHCRRVFRTGITHEEWEVSWDNVKEDNDDRQDSDRDDDDDDDEDDDDDRRSNKGDRDGDDSDDDDSDDKVKRSKKDKKSVKSKKDSQKPEDSSTSNESSSSSSSSSEEKKKPKKASTKGKNKLGKRNGKAKQRVQNLDEDDLDSTIEDNVNEPTDLK